MVPHNQVDNVLFGEHGLAQYLERGDFVIDGGNSLYKKAPPRKRRLAKRGIKFVDVGVSGGPAGARGGAALMIGGEVEDFKYLEQLFADIAAPGGYKFFAGTGAGHFVKMVHNGIEYGMMQAIAEGFQILKASKYRLNLDDIAQVYNHGSVIESRLIGWLKQAFELYGPNLEGISGSVEQTGEGAWTVQTAKELKLKAKVIEEALNFRLESERNPSYAGKILSALREQFGGHHVKSK
jgi:6-phosphogluconate dehydrogenase